MGCASIQPEDFTDDLNNLYQVEGAKYIYISRKDDTVTIYAIYNTHVPHIYKIKSYAEIKRNKKRKD